MLWILLAILSYVLLAGVSLGDRKLLSGSIRDPKVYAFYVGALGACVLAAVPFLGFPVPDAGILAVALIAGALFILGAYALYFGLHNFEASRVIPAAGALTPIFTLALTYFIFPDITFSSRDGISFLLFIAGIVLLTHERSQAKLARNLVVAAAAAWMFGASFALSKFVYTAIPFWDGFLWMRLGGVLPALAIFLAFPLVRKEIFRHKKQDRAFGKIVVFFLLNQILGAMAVIIQSAAIAIAPIGRVAFVNALQGVQYAILFAAEFLMGNHKKRHFDWSMVGLRIAGIATIAGGLTLFALR